VTDLAVIAALNAGRLSGGEAVARALVVVDAAGPVAKDATALLAALAPAPAEAAAWRSAWPAPHRAKPGEKL
jgi:hypothetical protein